MAKTFQLAVTDVAALMALMPGNQRRKGYSYNGSVLTIEDDREAARVAAIIGDQRWRDRALGTQLKGYASRARYLKESAGITVDGNPIATDRDAQSRILAAHMLALVADPATIFHWKKRDGSFAQLTPLQVIAIAKAVAAHVETCFDAEARINAAIMANPLSMTEVKIDSAFAAIQ
jgi:hypothetical protein